VIFRQKKAAQSAAFLEQGCLKLSLETNVVVTTNSVERTNVSVVIETVY